MENIVSIEEGYAGFVITRSTLNRNGVFITSGLYDSGYHGAGYAQKNKDLRQSEKEAYLKGNMCFRDWEDGLKQSKPTIYNEWRNNCRLCCFHET